MDHFFYLFLPFLIELIFLLIFYDFVQNLAAYSPSESHDFEEKTIRISKTASFEAWDLF